MLEAICRRLALTAIALACALPARADVRIRVANASSATWTLRPQGLQTFGSIRQGRWPGNPGGDPKALHGLPPDDLIHITPGTILEMAWNDQAQPWGGIRFLLLDRSGRQGCGAHLALTWGPERKPHLQAFRSLGLFFQPAAGDPDPGTLEPFGEWSKDGGTFILRADTFRFRSSEASTGQSSAGQGSSSPVSLGGGSRKRKREDGSSSAASSEASSPKGSGSKGSESSRGKPAGDDSSSGRPSKRARHRLEQDGGGSASSAASEEHKQAPPKELKRLTGEELKQAAAGSEPQEPDPERPGKVEPLVIRNDSDVAWQFHADKLPRSFLVEFRWAPGRKDLKDQGLHQGTEGFVVIPPGETAYFSPAAPADESGLVFELPFTLAQHGSLAAPDNPFRFHCTFDHLSATLGEGKDRLGYTEGTLGLEVRVQGRRTLWLPPAVMPKLPLRSEPKS